MAETVAAVLFIIFSTLLVISIATSGFTNFGFWGLNDPHKFCEHCHRRVRRIKDSWNPVSSMLFGYDSEYECPYCGHKQTAHHFVYD